jgi:hypothetical protein
MTSLSSHLLCYMCAEVEVEVNMYMNMSAMHPAGANR